ncbi:hypothetical protein LY048_004085 [Salmonella enterica]|nr:hypothetical protein [Salmonella enterica]EJG7296710.1 hypothetical protein [Salmonella enterica]EJH2090125.1 hypothetical protein [Salmonella enterica]
MATGWKNNKSETKGIRFPHNVTEEINAVIEEEKKLNPRVSFSSWVVESCLMRLQSIKLKK